MPLGIDSASLSMFYNGTNLPEQLFGKSIQRTFQFMVFFLDNPFRFKESGIMPIIMPFHVVDVTIPNYRFRKESQIYGQVPRTFPVLDVDDLTQMTVDVTFEEDEIGTIAYYISWLQRNIIKKNGLYNNISSNRVGKMIVEVQNKNGIPIVYYIFHKLYYLGADSVTYSYETNDSVKYKINYGFERMSTVFTGAGAAMGAAALGKNLIDKFKNGG